MLKLFIRLSILWFGATSPLYAQEVIDPLEKNVNAQVKAVSSLVTVNNDVYFVAEVSGSLTPTALMKLHPGSQQFSKVADIPEEMQLLPTRPIYIQDDTAGILPVRDKLLMPKYRQWFDPSSNTFKSTFAAQPPSFKAQCKLQWDKDLLLVCTDYQGLELQKKFYRMNKTDLLFYPIQELDETSYYSFKGKELLCNSDICGDLTFLTSYQNQPNAKLHIQQEYLYWVQSNGDVIMQSRKNGDLQKLDTSALVNEQITQDSYIAFARDYVLYQTGLPNGPITIKRLHLPSQRIDLIDSTVTTSNLFGLEGKSFGADGNFLLWNTSWGNGFILESWRLAPQDVKITVVQSPVQVSGSYNDYYQIEMALSADGAVITSETCYKWYISEGSPRSISCVLSDSPGFIYVSNQKNTPAPLKVVNSRPATPIRQLTSWDQQLFWHEIDEQPRFKRLQPRTGQIDIVAADKSGRLLAGKSALWLYSENRFYRFNPATNRFDTNGIDGAKGPEPVTEEMGMLVDDDFYYFVNNPLFSDSASLNRFNLSSGLHQTLKLFLDIDGVRILGIYQGKIYLSYSSEQPGSFNTAKGGILDLTSLSIEHNDAFADYHGSGGMVISVNRLLRVFMHQQQLFGFSAVNWIHDYGRGSRTYLSKLDLKQQVRLDLNEASEHQGRAIIVNNSILTSSGEQFSADGTWSGQPLNSRFHQALTFTDSTYLLGDNLQKLQSKNGVLQALPVSMGANTVVSPSATMAEVAGKLYLVATDSAQGERIRQIQLDNRPPVALDDTSSTNNATAISIEVLKNDNDPDLDNLRVVEAKATHGTVTILTNQQLSYQPKAGYVGNDEITYSIDDNRGGRANATVTINVSAAPIITPEQPATVDSGKSGGGLSAICLLLLGAFAAIRKLRPNTQAVVERQGVSLMKNITTTPFMRHLTLLVALILAAVSPLQAQQVIDPTEENIQQKVSALSQHIFVLDNQVFFAVATEQGQHAILKLDPNTNQISKATDIPQRLLSAGTRTNASADLQLEQIGQRLLINNQEWFEPTTATFSSAFASPLPSPLFQCQLEWNNGLVLVCFNNKYDDTPAKHYRLNKLDMKFYPDDTDTAQANSIQFKRDGLFCYVQVDQYRCTEWPSMQAYNVPDSGNIWQSPEVQQNYIFFQTKDNVVMQRRHSNTQTILNITALRNERSATLQAFSPEYILFNSYVPPAQFQLKRLHIPTQRVDLIDSTQLASKVHGTSLLSAITLNDNGTFLLQYYDKSTFKLTPSQIKPEIIELVTGQKADSYLYPLAWVQLPGTVSPDADVITVADSCLRLGMYVNYLSCRNAVPRLNRLNTQQTIDIPVPAVNFRPATPIRQLTGWDQQLFWYEHNGQWQIKRYQPQTGRTDIIDTDQLSSFTEPGDRKLLAGTSALWQLKNNEFYRFNTEMQKFEASATQGAMAQPNQGVLIDNDFYYFVLLPSPKNPQGFSSSFRKFSLTTGQYQELKLFDDIQIKRILNVSQGKFYLTYRVPPPGSRRGGILYLNDLTIKSNNALAFGELLSVFEFQQQLFGLGWGHIDKSQQELVQLNLANESVKVLDISATPTATPRATVLGSTILTGWGTKMNIDTTNLSARGFKFHQALTTQQNTYLLGDKIYKISAVDGEIQAEPIQLPAAVFIDATSSMAELDGKLYFVAKDVSNGERIWQVSL